MFRLWRIWGPLQLGALSPSLENLYIWPALVSVEGDNINVVALDAVIPITTSMKHPIEIVTTTKSFEWSSSKDGVAPHTLKIPKMEKLE
ncbi:hypothetical protein Lser_V15G01848 [Lactuca serriola]